MVRSDDPRRTHRTDPEVVQPWLSARAWEQSRAAASGRCAVEIVERRVEVPVSVEKKVVESPRGGPAWLPLLADLTRHLDSGRVYDRDLTALLAAINAVCESAERRLRQR